MQKMSFKKFFSIFSSGLHFVQPSGTILAILVEGHWRNTSLQIFWNQAIGQGRDFLFVALATILFSGVEPLRPSWNSDQQNFSLFWSCCYRASSDSKRPKVWEEMSKIDFQDGGCDGHLGFSIGSFSYFVSTRCPNAHHQVSVQLDYRGDVQNMNSQHFSYINIHVYGPYKCMGKQI